MLEGWNINPQIYFSSKKLFFSMPGICFQPYKKTYFFHVNTETTLYKKLSRDTYFYNKGLESSGRMALFSNLHLIIPPSRLPSFFPQELLNEIRVCNYEN